MMGAQDDLVSRSAACYYDGECDPETMDHDLLRQEFYREQAEKIQYRK